MKPLDINKDRDAVIARLNSGKVGEAMSDPRLEQIGDALRLGKFAGNPAETDVAYLLALIDTLQRERDEALKATFSAHEMHGKSLTRRMTAAIEIQEAKARADAAEAQVSRLTEALRRIGLVEVARTEEPETLFSRVVLQRGRRLRDELIAAVEPLRDAAHALSGATPAIQQEKQCPNEGHCPCDIGTRHFWFESFCAAESTLREASVSPPSEGWRDSESAPKDGTEIIAWTGQGMCFSCYDTERHAWIDLDDPSERLIQFDFWMPLPAPPASAGTVLRGMVGWRISARSAAAD